MEKQTYSNYYKEYYEKNKEKLKEYKRNYEKNRRYVNKARIEAVIPKDLFNQLKEKLNKKGLSLSEFIKIQVEKYLKED